MHNCVINAIQLLNNLFLLLFCITTLVETYTQSTVVHWLPESILKLRLVLYRLTLLVRNKNKN